MANVTALNAAEAPSGALGQKYLVSGHDLALRMWHDEPPGEAGPVHRRDYETVGIVVLGRVELTVDGASVTLSTGDSWHVPRGAERSYRVIEALTAVEATHPPARETDDAPPL